MIIDRKTADQLIQSGDATPDGIVRDEQDTLMLVLTRHDLCCVDHTEATVQEIERFGVSPWTN